MKMRIYSSALISIFFFYTLPAFSCGTIEGWVKIYNKDLDAPATGYTQKAALGWLLECPYSYGNTEAEKGQSDALLLPVVIDALSRSSELELEFKSVGGSFPNDTLSVQELLERIVEQYRCLSGAKYLPGYSEAFQKLEICASAHADTYSEGFPPPEVGFTRYVITLPEIEEESLYQVELKIGRVLKVDSFNKHFYLGSIEQEERQGYPYKVYKVSDYGRLASTRAAPGPIVERFVSLTGPAYLIPYNSKLPIVIYVPSGGEVRYRLWSTDSKYLKAYNE